MGRNDVLDLAALDSAEKLAELDPVNGQDQIGVLRVSDADGSRQLCNLYAVALAALAATTTGTLSPHWSHWNPSITSWMSLNEASTGSA